MYYYPYEGNVDVSVEGFVDEHRRRLDEDEVGMYCSPSKNDNGMYTFYTVIQKKRKKPANIFGLELDMVGKDEYYIVRIILRVMVEYEKGIIYVCSYRPNRRAAEEIINLIMNECESIVVNSGKIREEELADMAIHYSGQYVDFEKGEWIRQGRRAKEKITLEGVNINDILQDGEIIEILGLMQHQMKYARFRLTMPGYHREIKMAVAIEREGLYYSIQPTSRKGVGPKLEEYSALGINALSMISGQRVKVQKQLSIDAVTSKL